MYSILWYGNKEYTKEYKHFLMKLSFCGGNKTWGKAHIIPVKAEDWLEKHLTKELKSKLLMHYVVKELKSKLPMYVQWWHLKAIIFYLV